MEYLAGSYGYTIETHTVTTSDGYILTLHRIPSGRTTKYKNGKVAFLQHGILCSAADWIVMGPEKSLALMLADEGYDVWLGNARGNTWSKKHVSLDTFDSKYWQFSWHQIGDIDLPTMIDYVLEQTGVSQEYLAESYGYTIETHNVTTSDGYILTLHRIPSGRAAQENNGKVAFLQHGILCSAADWIVMGPGKSLALMLADEGYDVWMGNARGNTWSKKHVSLDTNGSEYWQFSWHQIGDIDMPTMIDYVLEQTGVSQVYYVGHSQGTTVYYVMLSMHPEYNSKIKIGASLAPIGYMDHMTGPLLRVIALYTDELNVLGTLIGVDEFAPTSDFFKYIAGDVVCSENSETQLLCENILFALCGFDYQQLNDTLLPIILKYLPAGCSTKQPIHYGQEINSGYFRQYDYGSILNLVYYNSLVPPSYNLSNIATPTYLYYSLNDWLSAETDVLRLCEEMGSACKETILNSEYNFNHLDYLYGINTTTLINNEIISLFDTE
ncbi:lipase 3-like isoform X4 [Anthonomus grandis grandis]|uniref:lipase 3-like isoform X3 n=1 Tax=Anthonomus grandis grandis TaxID=2921223 RepID=UPI002165A0AF|nr:lipase 3-like isoform X3 [Anthonomus grandis grandis]XP_050303076.1 lipase 3-like isoform X4 [Anthonomus grandis grandis]